MSNPLAIAAVTATLRELIKRGVRDFLPNPDENVTTKPLDQARTGNATPDRINIFLYQTVPNAAWRNMDMPRQVRPGETGQPPLALNLHYLITAYGQGDEETKSHRWLGRAMSVLHDHPLLGAQEIRDALPDNSELQAQIERVRITPQSLSLEDMSKLWTTFQTQYRISAAYQVEVVLIESTRAARAPLPVLSRGQDDTGVNAQADLIPPFPTILTVQPPKPQESALLDSVMTITGHHLDGVNVSVEVQHPQLPNPLNLPLEPGRTSNKIEARIPNQPNNFPPGFYTLKIVITRFGETFSRTTNELPFSLAPQIVNKPLVNPISVVRNPKDVTVTLDCQPSILPEQRVALLLGGREVLAEPHPLTTNRLTFVASTTHSPIPADRYFVRLRVNGVDSQLVKYQGTPPRPFFDTDQQVTIP